MKRTPMLSHRSLAGRRLIPLLLAGAACAALAQSPITTFEYDPVGNRTRILAPLARTTVIAYDALNRPSQTTDAAGGVVRLGYDGLDRIASVTDPRNLVTGYQYNGLGDLLALTSPDTGTTQYTYDDAGNALTRTDAKGQVISYQYDAANRITRIQTADGQVTDYQYDQGVNGANRLTGISHLYPAGHPFAGTLVLAFAYDGHGRLVGETRTLPDGQSATLSYQYDAGGRLAAMTYPSGRQVVYQYDAAGRVSEVTTTADGQTRIVATGIGYRPFGPAATHVWGNAVPAERGFDTEGRQNAYPLGTSHTLLGYDDASHILWQTDAANAANTVTYGYDALDRLTGQAEPTVTRSWSYDVVGNRTSQVVGSATTAYQYGATNNRLVQAGIRTVASDANGSIANDGNVQYAYDARGRLISSSGAAGPTDYLVDPLGRRLMKRGPLGSTAFLYDPAGHLVAELDGQGNLRQEHLWANDIPVAVAVAVAATGSSELHYVQTDQLGTPRAVVSQQNQVLWRWEGEAFGTSPANEDPDANSIPLAYNLRFPGQYFDKETNTHYNYFRDYDPATGRYVSADPIGLAGGSMSLYTYVDGNPISYTDPKGLFRMYGNWGGANWSGGQSGSTIPANPAPPTNAYDACYMQHDYCYAQSSSSQGQSCSSNTPSIRDCDVQLAKCTMSVASGTGGWWGSIFGTASTTWAIFKGELGK
jgi:RHS repeat-associated protein